MGVEAYVGFHGQGKTYSAFEVNLRRAIKRRAVFATNAAIDGAMTVDLLGELLDSAGAVDQFCTVHFNGFDEFSRLLELAEPYGLRIVLLFDEAGKFLNNRKWATRDDSMLTLVQERRKLGGGVDLILTAPSFKSIDPSIRAVVQYVSICRRFGGSEYSHDTGRPPRAFWVKTYRPHQIGDADGNVPKRKARPVDRRIIPFSKDLATLYDTAVLKASAPEEPREAPSGAEPAHRKRLRLAEGPAARRRAAK